MTKEAVVDPNFESYDSIVAKINEIIKEKLNSSVFQVSDDDLAANTEPEAVNKAFSSVTKNSSVEQFLSSEFSESETGLGEDPSLVLSSTQTMSTFSENNDEELELLMRTDLSSIANSFSTLFSSNGSLDKISSNIELAKENALQQTSNDLQLDFEAVLKESSHLVNLEEKYMEKQSRAIVEQKPVKPESSEEQADQLKIILSPIDWSEYYEEIYPDYDANAAKESKVSNAENKQIFDGFIPRKVPMFDFSKLT